MSHGAPRPTATAITLTDSETASIDVDSTGRMWLATESGTNLNVFHSASPYTTFAGPITLANNIASDDIGVVSALPNNTIGVLWSNQSTQRFGFKTHVDGANVATWTADEVPTSESALNVGPKRPMHMRLGARDVEVAGVAIAKRTQPFTMRLRDLALALDGQPRRLAFTMSGTRGDGVRGHVGGRALIGERAADVTVTTLALDGPRRHFALAEPMRVHLSGSAAKPEVRGLICRRRASTRACVLGATASRSTRRLAPKTHARVEARAGERARAPSALRRCPTGARAWARRAQNGGAARRGRAWSPWRPPRARR